MKEKLGSVLFALVFAVCFGGVGAGATYGITHMVRESLRAGDWVLVQAKVDSSELTSSRGTKGGYTYAAKGSYSYDFGGKRYASSQLGFDLFGGSDNIGDWHQDMAAFLQDARTQNKTIPIFVNPDSPQEAVVDRDIRWPMLFFMLVFALGFGGVGLGALIALGFILFAPSGGKSKGIAGPRKMKVDFAQSASTGLIGLWFFAIIWNGISIPAALLAVPQIIETGEYLGLLVLLFPIVGIGILWAAIAATVSRFRGGKAAVHLQTTEPRMGERLAGAVHLDKGLAGEEFRLRLSCFEQSGEGTPTLKWWKGATVRAAGMPEGVRVPFHFELPPEVAAARVASGASELHWMLAIFPGKSAIARASFPIVVKPAEKSFATSAESLGAAEAAAEPVLMTAAAGPASASPQFDTAIDRLFGTGMAARLGPEQRAALAQLNLTPEQQALAKKMVDNAPKIKKVVIGVVVAFIALQVLGAIVTVIASLAS